MKSIEQFMWGYQSHFRHSLEFAAERSLQEIGVIVAPKAILVGFEEKAGDHPICVEPEDVGIDPEIFSDSMVEGDSAYESHEHRNFVNTHARTHAQFHEDLRDRCRAAAIAKVLNSDPRHNFYRWFVGGSARVGRYRVFPVIGVIHRRWNALPSLFNRHSDHRTRSYLSLQEAVIGELLLSATFALSISDEPQGLRNNDQDEIVRRGARDFIRVLKHFKGDFKGGDLASALNAVSAQPYEGRTGVGTMLLATDEDYLLELVFDNPIPLKHTRALRKAIEMTDQNLHLVTDGNVAIGLGTISENYDTSTETALFLRIIGRGSWELVHHSTPLLVVIDGQPAVPRERLDNDVFQDAVERIFGIDSDVDQLWRLAIQASKQPHGTMLVVHADAANEATRLSPPAMRIEPDTITDSTLLAISAIDGAILVDPGGRCHAVGTILDGRASPGMGDASRGARFNSAHRYLAETNGRCLIIIVSEDGMLNLIPNLPRRVKRSYVRDVLDKVDALSRAKPINFEDFFRDERHLRSLAFYLSEEQCAVANHALERVEDHREATAKSHHGLGYITRVGHEKFQANPELDDVFFLPED